MTELNWGANAILSPQSEDHAAALATKDQELREASEDAQAIATLLTSLNGVTDLREIMRICCESVQKAYGWTCCVARSGVDGSYVFRHQSGEATAAFSQAAQEVVARPGRGLAGRAAADGQLVFANDIEELVEDPLLPACREAGIRSAFAFPTMVDGRATGILECYVTEYRPASPRRLQALKTLAQIVSSSVATMYEVAAERAAVKQKQERVAALLSFVQSVATGDLSQRTEIVGEDSAGQMGDALNLLTDSLHARMAEIGTSAQTLAAAAQRLTTLAAGMDEEADVTSERAASVSTVSGQVSTSIQMVSNAAEQMTGAVREIAQNAVAASSAAVEAVAEATSAQRAVGELG